MAASRESRRRITERLLLNRPAAAEDVQELQRALQSLESVPRQAGAFRLRHDGRPLRFELSYEIGELHKDLVYLREGEEALVRELGRRNPGFAEDLQAGRGFLRDAPPRFRVFLSDRDGTVNNYCGRYYSSVQSAYNAVFLTRFARRRCRRAVILSSAPLEGGGLADLSVAPPGVFVLAGSKGREALDERGRRHRLAVPPSQQSALEKLNRGLSDLIGQPQFEIFGLIGSGLQLKFGQSTVAHQDVHDSIPEQLSCSFRDAVRSLVQRLDADRSTFRIEDTGRDLEILLTVNEPGGGNVRDFDKGDGVGYLDRELALGLDQGPLLICGDTPSDLPMVQAAVRAGGDTWSVFVTRDSGLREALRAVCRRSCFVGAPDVLVSLLNEMGKERE